MSLLARNKKYILNTGWIALSNIFNSIMNVVVLSFLAKHLGTYYFGVLSYSISITALFAILGHFGINNIIVRKMVNSNKPFLELSIGLCLKVIGNYIGLILLITYALFYEKSASHEQTTVLLLALSILPKPLEIIEQFFHSKIISKFSSLSKIITSIIINALKIIAIITDVKFSVIIGIFILETFLYNFLLLSFFKRQNGYFYPIHSIELNKLINLAKEGSLSFAGTVLGLIYLKIDQVMLRWFSSLEEVGRYSIASKFSESMLFIAPAIVSSFYPLLIKRHQSNSAQYLSLLSKLFRILTGISIIILISFQIIGHYLNTGIVNLKDYSGSIDIFLIHSFSILFILPRALISKWIVIEKFYIFSIISQGCGAVINILLNLYLIPLYNGEGAAISTLISYSFASYIALLFTKKTLPLFRIYSLSFVPTLKW